MISPNFPPMGVVGAKRSLHFARHLPALGWRPAVVALPATVERDPALDSLIPDLPIWRGFRSGPLAWVEDLVGEDPTAAPQGESRPDPVRLQRGGPLRTLKTSFDRYTHYLPWALAGAWRLCRRERCEVIYVNAGPHSGQMLGWALSKLTGLPLVLDLRDPWSIEPDYRAARTAAANRLVERMEARFFGHATRVILNTERTLSAYQAHYGARLPANRFTIIRNAFDLELMGPPPAPRTDPECFRILFFGHLRPERDSVQFLHAYRAFIDREKLTAAQVRFVTMGRRSAADDAALGTLALGPYVETIGWVPLTQSRAVLGAADLLLDLIGPNQGIKISGKFYDYLGCERPILSVTPNDEVAEILHQVRAGRRVPLDTEAISGGLSAALADARAGRSFTPDRTALAGFTARAGAEKLAAILTGAAP